MNFETLYGLANDAGWEAGASVCPEPIVWKDSRTGKTYEPVTEGLCGFAWINVKPANSRFAKWLVAEGVARKDSYYGGVCIWVREFNQSHERKVAYAEAFAKVLEEAGIKCSVGERLD